MTQHQALDGALQVHAVAHRRHAQLDVVVALQRLQALPVHGVAGEAGLVLRHVQAVQPVQHVLAAPGVHGLLLEGPLASNSAPATATAAVLLLGLLRGGELHGGRDEVVGDLLVSGLARLLVVAVVVEPWWWWGRRNDDVVVVVVHGLGAVPVLAGQGAEGGHGRHEAGGVVVSAEGGHAADVHGHVSSEARRRGNDVNLRLLLLLWLGALPVRKVRRWRHHHHASAAAVVPADDSVGG